MRISTLVAFVLLIVLGCGVYNVANRYEKSEKKLNAVNSKIAGEEEAIRVLQAEWTFLTSPDRLERISQEFLQLQAIDGSQYVMLASVPMRATMENQAKDTTQTAEAVVTPKTTTPKTVAQKPAAQGTPQVAAKDDEAFQQVLAKELAPVATTLPPAAARPLPTLQATPVRAEVTE